MVFNKMIKVLKNEPLTNPKFVKSSRLIFEKDQRIREWEVVDIHDSVAVLIYHKKQNSFVLVRQFRPAVYLKNGDGMTIELCAGLVDKDKSLKQIVKEEILEECGYDVPIESIEKITSFYTAVGFAGGRQTLFFTEVDESMKVNDGGGVDDEEIEVFYLPIKKAKSFVFDEDIAKTPGLMYAFLWYFDTKKVK